MNFNAKVCEMFSKGNISYKKQRKQLHAVFYEYISLSSIISKFYDPYNMSNVYCIFK